MTYQEWQKAEHGYECLTTYWDDFSIADAFGVRAVEDTYKNAMANERDYKILTEIVLVLNHKIWQHYENNEKLALVYDRLWRELDNRLVSELKGKELSYFLRITD